jgi:hypothetical protein
MANEHRPPYVYFERRPVEDRNNSIAEGRYVTKDVDFITIVPYGSEGKTKVEREWSLWLTMVKQQTGSRGPEAGGFSEVNSRFEADWVQKIETMYALWKKGEDMDVEGYPLKNWPVISPGQLRTCHDMHLLTVEQLAHSTDDLCQSLGMGGISLRQRARDFLAALTNTDSQMSSKLAASEVDLKNKEVRIKSLEEQLVALQAQVQAQSVKKAA